MPVCSIYSSVYKPFIKEHNDLTPLFLFSEQTLLSVTTLVCSLKTTQLHCHRWGGKQSLFTTPWCFLLPHIPCEFTSSTQTLDGTILKMLSNSPRSTNTTQEQFRWGILFLCEWLNPRTLPPFRWVSLEEKNKWTDFTRSSKHTAAFGKKGWILGFFGLFFHLTMHNTTYLCKSRFKTFVMSFWAYMVKRQLYDSSRAMLKH